MALVLAGAALAQMDPIEEGARSVTALREQGRFLEAAAARSALRTRLGEMPAGADDFPQWVLRVAGLYSAAGRTAEARTVVFGALARLPGQQDLLTAAADLWEEDRNLVEAAAYVERAGDDRRLGELYLALGRMTELAAVVERLRAHPDEPGVGELLEAMGLLDEAAASYRTIGEREDAPGLAAAAWSALARLESGRDREGEAEAARRRSRELTLVADARPRLWLFQETEGMPGPASEATLREARAAALRGRVEDAFVLGLQAIVETGSGDDDPVFVGVPLLASLLAERKARGMADSLWDRLWGLAEARQADTLLPSLSVARAHARYLMEFRDGAARDALSRYRDLSVLAHGAASGGVVDALRLSLEFAGARATAAELAELCQRTRGPALRCF